MTELIEVNVANLSGEALNWAVAKAEELNAFLVRPEYNNPWRVFVRYEGEVMVRDVRYAPQESWADGGPLIEKHQINLEWGGVDGVAFWWNGSHQDIVQKQTGKGPLDAACRAIVAAKLGDTVQVPKELI